MVLLAQAVTEAPVELTTAGAALMTVTILFVLALNAFCFYSIMREAHPEEHHHAPLEIDTQDTGRDEDDDAEPPERA
jgi:hypothetical protein